MAAPSRLFLRPSGGTPGITPTQATEWDFFTGFVRVVPVLGTKSNTAFSNKAVADTTATAQRDALAYQFIYPLVTGTQFLTSHTFKGRMLALEAATGNNLRSQVVIRVMASDGSTVRATLFAGDLTQLTTNPGSEWNTAARNISITTASRAAATISCAANYTSVAGDYLVIEVGYRKHAAASTTGTIRLGDNAAADLPENETQTTDGNTWLEFSGDLDPSQVVRVSAVVASTTTVDSTTRLRLRTSTSIDSISAVTATPRIRIRGATSIDSLSTVTVVGGVQPLRASALVASTSTVTAAPYLRLRSSPLVASTTTVTAATTMRLRASPLVASTSTVVAASRLRLRFSPLVASNSALVAATQLRLRTAALVASTSVLNVIAGIQGGVSYYNPSATIASISDIAVAAQLRLRASPIVASASDVTATVTLVLRQAITIAVTSDVLASVRLRIRGAVDIASTSTVQVIAGIVETHDFPIPPVVAVLPTTPRIHTGVRGVAAVMPHTSPVQIGGDHGEVRIT